MFATVGITAAGDVRVVPDDLPQRSEAPAGAPERDQEERSARPFGQSGRGLDADLGRRMTVITPTSDTPMIQ
jgi:hypothetical protein